MAVTSSISTGDTLLAEQTRILEMVVRGHRLPEVLAALCAIVEREARRPVRAEIALRDAMIDEIDEIDGIDEIGAPAEAVASGAARGPMWSTPIASSTGAVLGRFAVRFDEAREPEPDERRLVETLARTAALAIERDRADQTLVRDLRESEARYRAIVESTPECVKLVSADGRVLQMNAAGLRMLEVDSEAEVLGLSVYELVAPEHLDAFRAFNEAVCRGEGGTLEFEIISTRGTRRAMETTAVPLPSPTGGFVHLAVSRDVSARAAAAGALAESRARLDYAVRLSGVGFWYCDLPFDELIWDERVKEHFFLAPDARVTIDLFYERIHPDDREPTRAAIDSSIYNHGSYDVVYRAVDPRTGAMKWIRALGGAAYAPDGTPIRFDGVTVDVTAHKRDEERLARVARAALTIHSSSSLASVLQVVTQEARALIDARQVVAIMIGDDGAPIRATAHAGAAPAHEPAVETAAIDAVMRRVTRPLRLGRTELEAEAWPELAGCGAPPHGVLAVPFVGRDGRRFGFVAIFDKLGDELTAADEAIAIQLVQLAVVAIENARLYDRLRDQDRRKDEFLATLAHELRNPLAPIRTGLHVLEHDPTPDQLARTRDMMARQLGHLVRMVDDLLDISRVTLGKITLQRARVDLRSVLDSALEATRALVEARGHQLTMHLPVRALPLDVDPTRLSQVFSNLINNSAKYTPRGGRIAITAEADAAALKVRISDTGIGIPTEMLPYVFDMFTQVRRSSDSSSDLYESSSDRSQGGLGIGLTLVRRLVEMHGGSVIAESAGPASGSAFVVTLPLALASEAAPPSSEEPTPAASGLRVLVVDDNVDAAEMLAMLLEMLGHQIHLAHTGPAALDAAAAFRPQVIFLDIGLPGLNGYEVARRLRAGGDQPQPVLFALTGWGSDEDRREARSAGFDGHLVKPVSLDRIAAALATLPGSHIPATSMPS